MRTTRWSSPPGRLAWLALSGLALMALVLAAGAWVGLHGGLLGGGPQQLLEACLLMSHQVASGLWSWTIESPLRAVVLAFLVGSLLWALSRLALSLFAGWRVGRRAARYQAGRFPVVDRALESTPEIEPGRIRILLSAAPEGFTLGLIRPKICLSEGLLRSLTEPELEAVLRHENAHARARDPLWLAVVRFLSDFLWFLPISRILAGAFSELAEEGADGAAVSAGSDSLELASAIVKTAGGGSGGPRLAPALGGLALVERRVERLLGRQQSVPSRVPWGPGLASTLMIAVVLGVLIGPPTSTMAGRPDDPMVAMRAMMSGMMGNCVQPMNPATCSDRLMRASER